MLSRVVILCHVVNVCGFMCEFMCKCKCKSKCESTCTSESISTRSDAGASQRTCPGPGAWANQCSTCEQGYVRTLTDSNPIQSPEPSRNSSYEPRA